MDRVDAPEDLAASRYHDLTSAQKHIWTLGQIGSHDTFGHPILDVHFSGAFDRSLVSEVLARVLRRHPALRLRFRTGAGGRVEQHVDDAATLPLADLDISDASAPDAALTHVLAASPRFDLESELPIQARLVKLGPSDHHLILTLHPIIADSASLPVLGRDVQAVIAAEEARERSIEPKDGDSVLAGDLPAERRGTLAFWRAWLQDAPSDATLPTAMRDNAATGATRRHASATFDREASLVVRTCAARLEQPVSAVLLGAFNILLARYSGQRHLRFGVVLDRRGDTTSRIGRIEDIAPFKTRLTGDLSFADVIRQLELARGLADGNPLPYEALAQAFWTSNGENGGGFLQAIHTHRDAMPDALRTPGGLVVTCIDRQISRTDANLVLTTGDGADGQLTATLNYAADLYDDGLVARAMGHFKRIVEIVGADPDILLRDIALVDDAELDRLATPYHDMEADDPRPVHTLIAERARLRPNAPAVMFEDEVWSHGELERRANHLAHRLIAAGATRETCVAVVMRRSPYAVAAILAVLKAGAAFVPVEPDHPAARNDHILRDAGVSLAVSTPDLPRSLPDGVTVIGFDGEDSDAGPDHDPGLPVEDGQLAYVIYTSGSTGLPKGVAVEHGPLTRHCQATARVYGMNTASCELAFLPFSSDGGHERWIVPLMSGGSVVLPDKPLWTPEETFAAIRRHGVNNASFPTTYVQQLAEWADMTGDPPPMRLYSFGGEGMAQATFDLFSRALKADWLINGYGPTETIMTPMVWKVRAGTPFEGVYAPIGRAVGRRRIYVLDADLNPTPIGVTGELHLGGDGVARGYVGRGGLTADRFIPDPFSLEGGRLYRSGDLARWRPDGTVEFVGRVDHQVKLRGFRIEPGEIEAVLRTLPGVSECAVLLRQDGGQPALVGYVVPAGEAWPEPALLRRLLSRQLPEHMVPAAIVVLARMPLNANSKLDRAALPPPELAPVDIVAPVSRTETALCSVWSDVLGHEAIGVTQNFFDIGGNSLAALRVLGQIKTLKPDADISIADLFNHQTIRQLAAIVDRGRAGGGNQLIHLRSAGTRPMLYCFPGLLVSTREYVRLVDHLGPDQPATGFICYSLADQTGRAPSVPDITARYAEEIRRKSRGRPCAFLGWSWGGLLAYEAACMLKDDVDLKLIGMIDVCDMDTDFAIGAVPRFAPGEREALVHRVEPWLARTPMSARWQALLGSMDRDAYDQFLRFVGNSPDDLPEDGPDIGSREHIFWVLIENALIFRRHHLAPHDCPIQPWAAADTLNRGLNLIDWRGLSSLAAPAEIIEGTTHLHIIGAPAFHRRFAHRLDRAYADLSQAAE